MENIIKINIIEDFCDRDEIYCDFYKCPKCGNNRVFFKDNFCSDCGGKFEWDTLPEINNIIDNKK